MANDQQQYQEEEYLFSEDNGAAEGVDPHSAEASMPSGGHSTRDEFLQTWRKNIIVGVALLFVIFIVYKIIASLFSSKKVEQVQAKPIAVVTAQPQTTMAVNSSAITTNGMNQQPTQIGNPIYNPNNAQELAKLGVASQSMRKELDNLNNQTQNLQSSLDSISSQLAQLNTTVALLADKVQVQESRWQQAQKKPKPVVAKPVVKKEHYAIQAIIPGRAWLMSSKGATITVGEGMSIPGYGKVVSIDPKLGCVVMETGDVIQYSSSDQ